MHRFIARFVSLSAPAFQPRFVAAEREEMVWTVLKSALRVLRAEVAALSLYDSRRRQQRTVALASPDGHWSPLRSLTSKVPPGFACEPKAAIPDVLVLPDDEPQHPFAQLLVEVANTGAYVALDYGGAIFGTLHVVRPAALPFSAEERRCVRAIGDHAILALATVRVP